MSLKVKKITDKIIHVSADSQQELASTFLRFQEYYESPEWKGKIFTLGQYRKWYAETNGAFSYCEDWSGFNIPSYILTPFMEGLFDPLTEQEKVLVNWFKDRKDLFYVIGANSESDVLEHEICHGLWYTNQKYKDKCLKVVQTIDKQTYQKLKAWLVEKGYHESVVDDEIHAYVSTEKDLSDYGLDFDLSKQHQELRLIRKTMSDK